MALRVGDACSIKLDNIQFPFLVFTMQKTKKTLRLPIPSKLHEFLTHYIFLFKRQILQNNNYLAFSPRDNKGPIKTGSIRVLFTQFRRKYNYAIPYYTNPRTHQNLFNITPHTLRHFVLTQLYKKSNYNLLLCRDFAGHTKASTTADIYIENIKPEDMMPYVELI